MAHVNGTNGVNGVTNGSRHRASSSSSSVSNGSLFAALYSSELRCNLYKEQKNGRYIFENPCFGLEKPRDSMASNNTDADSEGNSNSNGHEEGDRDIVKSMRLRDFLASIPSFSDFTDQQLVTLETKAQMKDYPAGEVIFKQGDKGDAFFVIHKGAVDILVQDNAQQLRKGLQMCYVLFKMTCIYIMVLLFR
jgi:hypothetical protein